MGFLVSTATLAQLLYADSQGLFHGPGGLLGQSLSKLSVRFIGSLGGILSACSLLAVSLLVVSGLRIREVIAAITSVGRPVVGGLVAAARGLRALIVAMFPEKEPRARSGRERRGVAPETGSDNEEPVRIGQASVKVHMPTGETVECKLDEVSGPAFGDEDREAIAALETEKTAVDCAEEDDKERVPAKRALPMVMMPSTRARKTTPLIIESVSSKLGKAATSTAGPAVEVPKPGDGRGFIQLSEGDFVLPSVDLLSYQPPEDSGTSKDILLEMAERLERAMVNYGVSGKVQEIHMGPVVTMFEFVPAPGTRTGKIAQLENDLAMALEAQAVRIVAPIPGKAAVGIEVPNAKREMVYLKESLMDESFRSSGAKLQVALGKDIKGSPVSVNLAKMPHLLVAGTTGSGKSVAINAMITSILYNATPEDVRFIMVDPKMLELSVYEGIPHLLLPVVTEAKKANLALRWAVEEMERRYELMATAGVRDIAGYNALIAKEGREPVVEEAHDPAWQSPRRIEVVMTDKNGVEEAVEVEAETSPDPGSQAPGSRGPRKLPSIVIVIDEFADLMMVAPKDVETHVARLAQKARAAGLHLILATQRPSVDVITGLIKANFPSRIALQVPSKVDSRTILDQHGAEALLGNGDMLFSDRGAKLRRIHGAFLSDEDVHRVVKCLKQQGKPVYDMDILKPRDEDGDDEGGGAAEQTRDALFDKAVALVCESRQASVSYVQRRLQVGYNRAARMVEQMERDGIVGPTNGIKPREVLAPKGDYLTAAP
jgi:S-DNA-T family DNA segregation ATPase FtsK/SpoIIIE